MSIPFIKKLAKRYCASKRFSFTTALIAGTLVLLFSAADLFALNVPAMRGPVNDYAKMLHTRDVQIIEQYLAKLNSDTGVQIAVLTVPSLEGESIEDFSIRTVEAWKLGQAGKDNGVLLLVAAAEKKIRIEVGYGLEGVLTDMQAGLIIRHLIAPHFKSGDYGKGITAGIQQIAQNATFGEAALIDESLSSAGKDDEGNAPVIVAFLIALYIFGVILLSEMNKRRQPYNGSGAWRGAVRMLSLLSSLSRSSGGSWRSSGGFGGFSGGGGGFGGGGASGGW